MIITLQDAKSQGKKYYFTGKACKRGHISERLVSNRSCVECVNLTKKERDKKYYEKHKDKIKEKVNQWKLDNPDQYKARQKKHYQHNTEKIKKRSKQYYYDNYDHAIEVQKQYREKNKKEINRKNLSNVRLRQARKLQATPSWYDHNKVKKIYEDARIITEETGIPHHVDHIYPLKGKNVSGLHCHDNLRIIPASENMKKN